jgi:hypothetical protein
MKVEMKVSTDNIDFDMELNLLKAERLIGSLKAIFKGREQLGLDSAELSGIFGTIIELESSIDKALTYVPGDTEF